MLYLYSLFCCLHNSGDTEWVPYITEARELLALHKQALIRAGHIPDNNTSAAAAAVATAGADNSNVSTNSSRAVSSSARKKQSVTSSSSQLNSSTSRIGVIASTASISSSGTSSSRLDDSAAVALPDVKADTTAGSSGTDTEYIGDGTTDDSKLDVVYEGDISADSSICSDMPAAAKQSAVPSTKHEHTAPQATTTASHFSFYQLHDGQHVYLHPISMRCLLEEYDSNDSFLLCSNSKSNNSNSNSTADAHDNDHNSGSSDAISVMKQLPAELHATVLEVSHDYGRYSLYCQTRLLRKFVIRLHQSED
jgi:trimeric autotransporter adhesin